MGGRPKERPLAVVSLHLRERGWAADAMRWAPDPHGRHGEASWRRRAPTALEFLFSPHHTAERAA